MVEHNDYIHELLERIKIKTIMTAKVVKVYEYDELSKAEQLFLAHGIFYLPIVNQYQKLVGLLSHKYLYKTQSPRKIDSGEVAYSPDIILDGNTYYSKEILDGFVLRNVMLRNPFALSPEDSVLRAITEMGKRKIGCICIVTEDQKVCGILTESDLIRLAAKILNE